MWLMVGSHWLCVASNLLEYLVRFMHAIVGSYWYVP